MRSSMNAMPGKAAASTDGNGIRPRSESRSHRPRLRGRSFFSLLRPGSPAPAQPTRMIIPSGWLKGTHNCRIDGVKVRPTSNPSGERNRVTVCPHGSFLFLMSVR